MPDFGDKSGSISLFTLAALHIHIRNERIELISSCRIAKRRRRELAHSATRYETADEKTKAHTDDARTNDYYNNIFPMEFFSSLDSEFGLWTLDLAPTGTLYWRWSISLDSGFAICSQTHLKWNWISRWKRKKFTADSNTRELSTHAQANDELGDISMTLRWTANTLPKRA